MGEQFKGQAFRGAAVVRRAGLAAAVAWAAASGAALAQPRPQDPPVIPPQPGYSAPKISQAYAQALTRLPDWNGSYRTTGGLMFDPLNAVLPPDDDAAFDTGPLEGSYLKGVPYKPEYQKLYEQTIERAKAGQITDPVGDCRQPHGMPREMGGAPGGPEVIMLPSQVRMTWYWFNATRRIYTDGRGHPTGDDLVPGFMGHSIGKWEGDTLVVDTIGMNPGIYDRSGAPHSDQLHLTERIRMIAPGVLEAQMTMVDPVMLTRPWKVTRTFRRTSPIPQTEAAYCEGGRLEMRNGVQTLVLPSEEPANK